MLRSCRALDTPSVVLHAESRRLERSRAIVVKLVRHFWIFRSHIPIIYSGNGSLLQLCGTKSSERESIA